MKPQHNKEEEKKHQQHTNPDYNKKHQDKDAWKNPKKDGGCGPCGSCNK